MNKVTHLPRSMSEGQAGLMTRKSVFTPDINLFYRGVMPLSTKRKNTCKPRGLGEHSEKKAGPY